MSKNNIYKLFLGICIIVVSFSVVLDLAGLIESNIAVKIVSTGVILGFFCTVRIQVPKQIIRNEDDMSE